MEDSDCLTKIALFSGRFDPPTMGHTVAIQTLMLRYAMVLVVVLDYKGRRVPANKAQKLFDFHFDLVLPPIGRNRMKVAINKHHFGMITKEQLEKWLKKYKLRFDVYVSGNVEVLQHMESLGYECRYLPRVAFPLDYSIYSATDIRKYMDSFDMSMEDFYRLEKK
jgi:nicotinamide mononucleotide adenylyltransferase